MVELHSRMEELEGWRDRMRAAGTSMAEVVSDGITMLNHNYPSFSISIGALMT